MIKKRNQPEKKVSNAILNRLNLLRITGDVIWFKREEASDDQYCVAGTPDILALINCKDGRLAALFIEVKRPGVKRLRYEQKKFFESMEGKPMTLCVVINDSKQLFPAIKKVRNL